MSDMKCPFCQQELQEDVGYVDEILALETENKDLSDKIGKLEIDLSALRVEVSTKTWFRDVQINRPPYQQPMSYMTYNPATGRPEQKDK